MQMKSYYLKFSSIISFEDSGTLCFPTRAKPRLYRRLRTVETEGLPNVTYGDISSSIRFVDALSLTNTPLLIYSQGKKQNALEGVGAVP